MRFITEIEPATTDSIRNLIAAGKYRSVNEFIQTAIENQLQVESETIGEMDATILGQASPPLKIQTSTMLRPQVAPTLVDEPSLDSIYGTKLWALHNRIFPIKLVVRTLLRLTQENESAGGFIDADNLQSISVSEAVRLGKILSKQDSKLKNDPKLSTGLIVKTSAKSAERFKHAFVGSVVRSKDAELLDGAPAKLLFLNKRNNPNTGKLEFALTRSGYDFARLQNPILDDEDYTHSMSREEIDFYLNHITNKLPDEYDASIILLEAIASGKNTPTFLQAALGGDDAVRASQITRLVELGLVTRKRIGIRVEYSITEEGRNFLQRSRQASPDEAGDLTAK